MMERALSFLRDHKEIALATSEGNLPKLRIFQIMKQEGHVLYFATSAKKAVYRELRQNPNVEILAYADNIRKGMCSTLPLLLRRLSIGSCVRIPMLRYWPTQIIYPSDAQEW